MLHNANTRCNGLLPLWGPKVPETNFASCLARHNTYIQEATQAGEVTFRSGVDDLKLLLLRFAENKSFSGESGGGGAESNVQLIPSLMFLPLYLLNQARIHSATEKQLKKFITAPVNTWVPSSFLAEGPLYYTAAALLLLPPSAWQRESRTIVRRLLVLGAARSVGFSSENPPTPLLPDAEPREWPVYAGPLRLFAFVHLLFDNVLQVRHPWNFEFLAACPVMSSAYTVAVKGCEEGDGSLTDWSKRLQDYLRFEEVKVLEGCRSVLRRYQDDIQNADSASSLFAALKISDLDTEEKTHEFIRDTLSKVT